MVFHPGTALVAPGPPGRAAGPGVAPRPGSRGRRGAAPPAGGPARPGRGRGQRAAGGRRGGRGGLGCCGALMVFVRGLQPWQGAEGP